MSISVDNTSIVNPRAEIGNNVNIGPYSIIGPNVKIGNNCVIDSHVVIDGWTTIGENNRIFKGAVIGGEPQDLKYKGDRSYTVIGNNNKIREFVTVNRATNPDGETRIGNNCLLMAYSHVAHNCVLHDGIVMANASALGGHIIIESGVIIGGLTAIHQFVRIGRGSILGGMSRITMDIIPYAKASGTPCKLYGLNVIGLERKGFGKDVIKKLKKAYKILFRMHLGLDEACSMVEAELGDINEVRDILNFIRVSKRGLCR
jgi:UDP-N-acetylglucosamine acyltransferase